ncbi:avidin/streptavidin family protein [Fundidesulfovibrio terrae]|uniref:avidin/streptavidin family protein n=1 Tax=Fundidesulfovibrio terrae TaxID=2922866 RepID=UPI003C2F9405
MQNLKNTKTIVTWAGQHTVEKNKETILTHWLHITNISDDQEQDWMWYSNRIGSDTFSKR